MFRLHDRGPGAHLINKFFAFQIQTDILLIQLIDRLPDRLFRFGFQFDFLNFFIGNLSKQADKMNRDRISMVAARIFFPMLLA